MFLVCRVMKIILLRCINGIEVLLGKNKSEPSFVNSYGSS